MIIEKIELENFTCYYGKNTFEFSKGINIIAGVNGYGKSQLFDAFYWVLNDQVFMSKQRKAFTEVKSLIVSDRAKHENENGPVRTSVKIILADERYKKTYIIERSYQIMIKDGVIQENGNSELTVMEKDYYLLDAKLVKDSDKINSIINRILPLNKKEYLWFQGEQVDKIIDFEQQSTIKKAIDVLSNIQEYEEIKKIASELAQISQNEYERELRNSSRDRQMADRLLKEKVNLEDKLDKLVYEEEIALKSFAVAEQICERLLNQLNDAQKIRDLQNKQIILKGSLQESKELFNEEYSKLRGKMFSNKWVLKGTEQIINEFNDLFLKYENKRLEIQRIEDLKRSREDEILNNFQARLPFDVPEPIYVQKMLDEERCLVCDREAKKDSEAWCKIKELIDRKSTNNSSEEGQDKSRNDFQKEFRSLYNNGLSLNRQIERITEDIKDSLQFIDKLETKIRQRICDNDNIEKEIDELFDKTSLSSVSAVDIINEFNLNNKIKNENKYKLDRVTQQKADVNNSIKSILSQLENLTEVEVPDRVVEKRNLLSELNKICSSTKDRVFDDLVSRLEEQANIHYKKMTMNNRSITGKIKLFRQQNGAFMPAVTDQNDNPLLGLNTSNLILVKLSVIMAIISAHYQDCGGALEEGIDLYTFITDAPTSAFGDAYTIGFCLTVSKVYKQSIIMSKEFYRNENLLKELLNNEEIKVGKVYRITPSITEDERKDRTTLLTNIKQIN